TSSTPRLPPAPGLFSTATGWPRILVISLAVARVAMSTAPAGVNGTTMRIGLDGNAWPKAALERTKEKAKANRRDTRGPFKGRVPRNYGRPRPDGEYSGSATSRSAAPAARDLRLLRRRRRGGDDAAGQLRRVSARPAAAESARQRVENRHEGFHFRS